MMRASILSLLLVTVGTAQDIRFDFRDSHDLAGSLNDFSKLHVLEQRGYAGKEYNASNVSVEVVLPGGQVISGDLEYLGISVSADGRIATFRMQGPPMPVDEAYEAGKILYSAFSIPRDRLEAWHLDAGSGRDVKNVMDGNGRGYYPSLQLDIRPSMSERYPVKISFSIGWNILRNDDRDESWGKANNPKPPAGFERVSLNAPSGKGYDRRQEYRELNEQGAEFDRRIGQLRGPDGRIIREEKKSKEKKYDGKVGEDTLSEGKRVWLGIVMAAIVIAGLSAWKFKHDQNTI